MKLFPLFLALGITGTALGQPTIDPNFVATITVDADSSTLISLIDQSNSVTVVPGSESLTLYSDYNDGLLQFNFTNPDQIVYQNPDPQTEGLFDDVLNISSNVGTCAINGRAGTLWEYDPTSGPASVVDVCANGNTPFYMEWNLGAQGDVTAVFNTYIPGVPDAADFVPEPATFSLAAIAIAGAAWRKRRTT